VSEAEHSEADTANSPLDHPESATDNLAEVDAAAAEDEDAFGYPTAAPPANTGRTGKSKAKAKVVRGNRKSARQHNPPHLPVDTPTTTNNTPAPASTRSGKSKLVATISPPVTISSRTSPASAGKPVDLHKRNPKGETPIHQATLKNDTEKVQRLIALGAEVNCKCHAGWTPLHEACQRVWIGLAEILISAGANVNAYGLNRVTPLHDAVSTNSTELTRLLLDSGADPTLTSAHDETPLQSNEDVNDEIRGMLTASTQHRSTTASSAKSARRARVGTSIVLTLTGLPSSTQDEVKRAAEKAKISIHSEFSDKVSHVVTNLNDKGCAKRTFT
jgi:hypothetical protein